MKKYEYKVVSVTAPFFSGLKKPENTASEYEVWLNTLGAEGWELIQCLNGFYFFKREMK